MPSNEEIWNKLAARSPEQPEDSLNAWTRDRFRGLLGLNSDDATIVCRRPDEPVIEDKP